MVCVCESVLARCQLTPPLGHHVGNNSKINHFKPKIQKLLHHSPTSNAIKQSLCHITLYNLALKTTGCFKNKVGNLS
jgi:hypothetical protein